MRLAGADQQLRPRPCAGGPPRGALLQQPARARQPARAAAPRPQPPPAAAGALLATGACSHGQHHAAAPAAPDALRGAIAAPHRQPQHRHQQQHQDSHHRQQQHQQQQRRGGRGVACRAAPSASDVAKFANQAYLDKAAQRFRIGLEQGLDEDLLVAVELGASSREELGEAQAQYFDKIKGKLVARAAELAAEAAEARRREAAFLEAGKAAYERGQYEAAVGFLERAVEAAGRPSVLGGEALMWLALAYQACGREQECIDTYKWLEDNHPVPKVKKQAADLRYIMEAPKLELSPDERVTIPLLNSEDAWVKKGRKSPYTPRYNGAAPKPPAKKQGSYWDSVDWDAPLLPFVPDRWYVRVAWVVLLVGVTVYVNYHYGAGAGAAGGAGGALPLGG